MDSDQEVRNPPTKSGKAGVLTRMTTIAPKTHAMVAAHLPHVLADIVILFITTSRTNVHDVVEAGCYEMIEALAAPPASMFMDAGLRYDMQAVVDLGISRGAKLDETCFYWACRGGHTRSIERVIAAGVTAWNKGLEAACRRGNITLAEEMIKRGATHYANAVDAAANAGKKETVMAVLKYGGSMSDALGGACHANNVEMIAWAVRHGATGCPECGKWPSMHIRQTHT